MITNDFNGFRGATQQKETQEELVTKEDAVLTSAIVPQAVEVTSIVKLPDVATNPANTGIIITLTYKDR